MPITEGPDTRPAVLVNVIDANGNIIASEIMDYEVADFLRLRVDPDVAKGCTTVPANLRPEDQVWRRHREDHRG